MRSKIICGCVVDDMGHPVKGAFVVVESSEIPFKDIAIVTNECGVFRLELPAGDCSISAVTKSGMRGVKRISKYAPSSFTPTIHVHN
jgi:hypothetical protein